MKFKELYERLPLELREKIENCSQNPKYHPEGNLYNHIFQVFELCEKLNDKDLMVCALFHDLGKPESAKEIYKDGQVKITHIGHETKCKKFIDKYFYLYSDLTTNKEKVLEVCEKHMLAHYYKSGQLKKFQKRKNFEELKYYKDILQFADCDENGRKEIK